MLVTNLEIVPGRRIVSHYGIVRFATTSIAAGAAEILAYGSAVQLDGN